MSRTSMSERSSCGFLKRNDGVIVVVEVVTERDFLVEEGAVKAEAAHSETNKRKRDRTQTMIGTEEEKESSNSKTNFQQNYCRVGDE